MDCMLLSDGHLLHGHLPNGHLPNGHEVTW